MAREIKEPSESAILGIWGAIRDLYRISPLGNERGEVGDEGGSEGAADGKEGTAGEEWDLHPSESDEGTGEVAQPSGEEKAVPDASKTDKTAKPSAETLKPEGEEEPAKEGEEEEPEEEEGEEKLPFHNHPRWKEVQTELASLRADLGITKKQAEFYQTQYNDLVGTGEEEKGKGAEAGVKPGEASKLSDELPQGIVKPGEWNDQTETAHYIDHRASMLAKPVAEKAIAETVNPILERTSKAVSALQEFVLKETRKDFNETIKGAWDEAFTMDPAGEITGVKNQALLNYFQQQPFPLLAAYEYGVAKQAPKKIKEGVQKQTAKTIAELEKKPKGPKAPKSGSEIKETPELDWDTPDEETEKILHKRGLI